MELNGGKYLINVEAAVKADPFQRDFVLGDPRPARTQCNYMYVLTQLHVHTYVACTLPRSGPIFSIQVLCTCIFYDIS